MASRQSADLIDGLLANALLGFHHPCHVENFLDCAECEVGSILPTWLGIYLSQVRRSRISPANHGSIRTNLRRVPAV